MSRQTRNLELYGVSDIDAYTAAKMENIDTTSCAFPELILGLVERAKDTIYHDRIEAAQTLARLQFLITRYCPLYRQSGPDQETLAA